MSKIISVIIPVYNSEKYISECLDSLLNQSFSGSMEILCVNDGSTDNSLAILNGYASCDSRIKVFTKQNEGKGAASARNLGLSKAAGDYIMFLDSDDFFEPDMIRLMVKKAAETDADLVICGADRYDDSKRKTIGNYTQIHLEYAPAPVVFSYRDCPDRIFQIGDVLAWNKLYRRKLIADNDLFFEEIPISDDQMIPALSLVLSGRITIVNKPLVHYRINTGSSQVDTQNRYPKSAYQATFAIVNRMREAGLYESVKQSYLNHAILLMREYFDKMTDYMNLMFLYHTYKDEVFPFLGADDLNKGYFYEERLGEWYEMIMNNSLEDILLNTLRAYGSPWNTAILRFRFPYEKVYRNADIVLVGKGLIGRYWYAQVLLSGYCQVVDWVNHESDIDSNLSYDAVVKAE